MIPQEGARRWIVAVAANNQAFHCVVKTVAIPEVGMIRKLSPSLQLERMCGFVSSWKSGGMPLNWVTRVENCPIWIEPVLPNLLCPSVLNVPVLNGSSLAVR